MRKKEKKKNKQRKKNGPSRQTDRQRERERERERERDRQGIKAKTQREKTAQCIRTPGCELDRNKHEPQHTHWPSRDEHQSAIMRATSLSSFFFLLSSFFPPSLLFLSFSFPSSLHHFNLFILLFSHLLPSFLCFVPVVPCARRPTGRCGRPPLCAQLTPGALHGGGVARPCALC